VFEPIAGLSREALGGLYLAAFTLAYLACLPGAFGGVLGLLRGALRPEKARFESVRLVPIVLVLPLSALAFGMSNFKILVYAPPLEVAGYRYFLPLLLFAILAIAVVADRWWERGGVARVGAVLVYAPALLGGLTSLAIVDWTIARPNLGAYYDGYDLSKLARGLLSTRNALEPAEIRSRLQSFPPAVRGKVTRAIGFNLGVFLIEKKGLAGALESVVPEILDTYPASAREDLACGVGIAARFHVAISGAGEGELLDGLDRSWGVWPESASGGADEAGDAAERLALVRGACLRNPTLPLAEQTRSILESTHALLVRRGASDSADSLDLAFASGQGHLCGRLARRGIPADLASVRDEARRILELSPAYAGSFWEGVGAGWVEEREPAEPFDVLRGIPGFDADRAASGAGRSVARVHREATEAAARAWRDSIAPAERPEFDKGLRLGLAESGG
jgi:hypothetical protein